LDGLSHSAPNRAADRQSKKGACHEQSLFEAVDRLGAMVSSDGQMQSISGSQTGFVVSEIRLGESEVVCVR